MKLITYHTPAGLRWGIAVPQLGGGHRVIDGESATGGRYRSVLEVLARDGLAEVRAALADAPATLELTDLRLAPPIPDPGKIFAIGLNYADHAGETGQAAPAAPVVFTRFADTLVGHGGDVVRPRGSTQLDYEGELAVVIGRAGRHIAVAEAMEVVAGYSCFNDASLRDFQRESITAGKNFPGTAPFGPWLVTTDEIADAGRLSLVTRLNGAVVQQGSTAQCIHSVAALIAYMSRFTALAPGDVIATGTPAGIGARRSPPLWMRQGDVVEVEIEGIGLLRNTVRDEA